MPLTVERPRGPGERAAPLPGCRAEEPVDMPRRPSRSPWTMPTFYLAPFVCAYLLAAMWILRGLARLRRAVSRG